MSAAEDEPRPTPTLHSAALWYAEQGLRIFPLSPRSKIPWKGSSGVLDASSNTEIVDHWWAHSPDANIGIATGFTIDVVDIDGPVGQASRAENWCAKGPGCEKREIKGTHWGLEDCDHGVGVFGRINADKVAVVTTPRVGGLHVYVPVTGEGNLAGIFPGIDYRGKGGYVVAPPSRTDVGAYRFLGVPNFNIKESV